MTRFHAPWRGGVYFVLRFGRALSAYGWAALSGAIALVLAVAVLASHGV